MLRFTKPPMVFRLSGGSNPSLSVLYGRLSERLKEQHWKCCIGAILSWVRIPHLPLLTKYLCVYAGVTQRLEFLPSKQDVEGSNPFARSIVLNHYNLEVYYVWAWR